MISHIVQSITFVFNLLKPTGYYTCYQL